MADFKNVQWHGRNNLHCDIYSYFQKTSIKQAAKLPPHRYFVEYFTWKR